MILDMIMPGMDGLSVFKILEQINPRVKVIITSGYAVDQRSDQILSSGPHGYLKKPYTLTELAEEIYRILDMQNTESTITPVGTNQAPH